MTKKRPRVELTHIKFYWLCRVCGKVFTEVRPKLSQGLESQKAQLIRNLRFCGCRQPSVCCDRTEETVGPDPRPQRVWLTKDGRSGRALYHLHLHCPKCEGHLEYFGGNLGAGCKQVPGLPELCYQWGGPWHEYRCDTCKKLFNWDIIPDNCWDVEMCLSEPAPHDSGLLPKRSGLGLCIFLTGPRTGEGLG